MARVHRPYINYYKYTLIQPPDKDTIAWSVPMLLVMPLIDTIGYLNINTSNSMNLMKLVDIVRAKLL